MEEIEKEVALKEDHVREHHSLQEVKDINTPGNHTPQILDLSNQGDRQQQLQQTRVILTKRLALIEKKLAHSY